MALARDGVQMVRPQHEESDAAMTPLPCEERWFGPRQEGGQWVNRGRKGLAGGRSSQVQGQGGAKRREKGSGSERTVAAPG